MMSGSSSNLFNDSRCVDDERERPAAPASPSNSWSSTETLPTASGASVNDEPPVAARPKRCKISREQLDVLVKSFEEEPLPNFDQRQAMAKHLGMTPRSVQIWFQNRRQRLKPIPKPAADGLPQPSASHQHHTQHFGMPGLAAAAGLFGAGYSHTTTQLPLQGAAGLPFMQMGDVMEPFAATKALLGAGYQPQSSMLNLGLRFPHGATGDAQPHMNTNVLEVQQTPSTQAACAVAGDGAATNASSAASATESTCVGGVNVSPDPAPDPAADGLLLLLACAGGGAPTRSGGGGVS